MTQPIRQHRQAYRDAVLETGPLAYWRCHDPHQLIDETGNYPGTWKRSPTLSSSTPIHRDAGRSIELDGASGQYAFFAGDAAILDPPNLSLMVWIWPLESKWNQIITAAASERLYDMRVAGNEKIKLNIKDSTDFDALSSDDSIPLDAWTCLIVTIDRANKQVMWHFDGQPDSSGGQTYSRSPQPPSSADIRIGRLFSLSDQLAHMRFSDFAIWDRLLNEQEIKGLYLVGINGGRSRFAA